MTTDTEARAKDRFEIGQRVKLSDDGIQLFAGRVRGGIGVVVGFGRKPELVRILREGRKQPETYHEKFWKQESGA